MSKYWKLSLTKLQMPSKYSTQTEISNHNGLAQFPASPFFILNSNLPDEEKEWYLAIRQDLLSYKQDETIVDERLRPYQNADVNFLSKIPVKGIFNEQRTGKTPTTLVTLKNLNQKRNIIIVPGITTYAWSKEYKKWHGGTVTVVTSKITKARRRKLYEEFEGSLIMTPGILKNDLDLLLKIKFDAIILDEAHLLRNYKGMRSKQSSQQSKAIIKLARNIPGRYALTGTPTPNQQWDLYGILCFLFPWLFTSYWKFIDYYFSIEEKVIGRRPGSNQLQTIREPIGFKSKQKEIEFLEFIETISTQRKRRDVMQWIPKVDIEEIALELTKEQKLVHQELTEWFEYKDIICKNTLDVMVKQQFLCHDPRLLGLESIGPKTEFILEYIKESPNTPLVIVSKSRQYLELIHSLIPNSQLIAGGLSNKKKQEIVENFQNGQFNVLLGQIDVIKEGTKLSRAEVMIFTDRSYTYTDNEQAEDRFIPTDPEHAAQKEQQKVIRLYMKNSIDEYKHDAISAKKLKADIVNDYMTYLNERRRIRD